MTSRGPIKLTPAQRRALETIAAGGVEFHRSQFSTREWVTVPDGRPAITAAVVKRLHAAGLAAGDKPVTITPYGRDVLAGTVRPPILATAEITLDGNTVAATTIEVDPYAWQLDDPGEREPYLSWLAGRFMATRVRATIQLDSTKDSNCGKPAEPGHCSHCHDDPPAGHVCPRCGVSRIAEEPQS